MYREAVMQRILSIATLGGLAACTQVPDNALPIHSTLLQAGVYRDASCTWPDKAADIRPCLCVADINAAQTGDKTLDIVLSEAASKQFCPGKAWNASTEHKRANHRSSNFEVTRNDDRWLSVVYMHYVMPAGAAHGMSHQQVLLYDKQAHKWLEQGQIVPRNQRKKLAKTVFDRLHVLNKDVYNGALWLDKKDGIRPDNLLNNEGCNGCVIYPDEKGWIVQFGLYSVGPYAIGMVPVQLSESLIQP
jgi:hypothetical protein